MVSQASRLADVRYDIRGPVLRRARELEAAGHEIIKLNLGNPAPFGLDAPDDVLNDVVKHIADSQGYSDARGIQRGTEQPVLVFDRNGSLVGSWGEGALAEPHYINAAPDGSILVADRDAHQVLRFDSSGHVLQALGKKGRAGRDDRTESKLFHDALQLACALLWASGWSSWEAGTSGL